MDKYNKQIKIFLFFISWVLFLLYFITQVNILFLVMMLLLLFYVYYIKNNFLIIFHSIYIILMILNGFIIEQLPSNDISGFNFGKALAWFSLYSSAVLVLYPIMFIITILIYKKYKSCKLQE